ncbi:CDP-diacylglycerol diphosphatase [Pseudomonas yamanorum]|uniref:CDP-diacylglycerol diphosphatase n=1 Tax=Pseudomonas yamanorum TaxID=515393 RepID=UPI0015A0241F|nr:CDP-diacylglycerol diphosphatase [Pseudomonas yamanorum]NVZ83366.1 CDP-diacylglycerol diphosphatase [Pseudomonas yamanorum]
MKRGTVFTLIGGLLCVAALAGALKWRGNPDVLWQIVSRQCVPDQNQHQNPSPCLKVDPDKGFVLLKDLNGPYQDLLIPTDKVTGIEDIALTRDLLPHYFAQAWKNHAVLSSGLPAPIADRYVSLAINSRYGRSQNQLHIHIACLRPDVFNTLNERAAPLDEHWQTLPVKLQGHTYSARTLSAADFDLRDPLAILNEYVQAQGDTMASYSLLLAPEADGNFVLLTTRLTLKEWNLASAEELQDHQCNLMGKPPQRPVLAVNDIR